MIRLLVAAPASGHGKTVVTCALLSALRRRGLDPCAFKCGPDYIDPTFHRAVSGAECHNLDLYLCGAERVRELFARSAYGHGAAVCESAMGYYDGLGGVTDAASAWRVACALDLPVLLAVRANGAGLSLAALVRGMREFRPDCRFVGVLLNDCTPALCRTLSPALERESGLPVLGCLPRVPEAEIPSRHLGLYTAAEVDNLRERLQVLSDALEANADLSRLFALCDGATLRPARKASGVRTAVDRAASGVRIAVARDEAFCFTYPETLEILEEYGAELVFFSPLRDAAPPDGIAGLYLPGGYPELYARGLSDNATMREGIADAVRGGMPTVAECGGFLYLGAALQDTGGVSRPMAGVLPGEGFPRGKSVRFGYGALSADTDSLLFRAGEAVPVHEFHHWDSTRPGDALQMEKPVGGRRWRCGFVGDTLYAGFPHLYFWGRPELARRFTEAARRYREKGNM
ncbi:MAG: cobyrinate a,c-diamide synthase [Oscillibacter sp.]|nr:cobyrinate a,c-diamide synthase [Oscillibacter sp.]